MVRTFSSDAGFSQHLAPRASSGDPVKAHVKRSPKRPLDSVLAGNTGGGRRVPKVAVAQARPGTDLRIEYYSRVTRLFAEPRGRPTRSASSRPARRTAHPETQRSGNTAGFQVSRSAPVGGGGPASRTARSSSVSNRERTMNRTPSGASRENPLPLPSTTSTVRWVCFHRSN